MMNTLKQKDLTFLDDEHPETGGNPWGVFRVRYPHICLWNPLSVILTWEHRR
jgi:hypothetical protein